MAQSQFEISCSCIESPKILSPFVGVMFVIVAGYTMQRVI